MKSTLLLFSLLLLLSANALGQEFKLPVSLAGLASKATETVEVNLDQRMLQLASKYLDSNEPDDVEAKKIIQGLKGIYVRSYEFAKPGEYSASELEPMRAQLLQSNEWSRIVGVKSVKDAENVDIFVKPEGDHFGGMWVISTEPTELVVVNIIGPINLKNLSELGGQFGIPKIKKPNSKAEAAK